MRSPVRSVVLAGALLFAACGGPSTPSGGTNGGGASCAAYAGTWTAVHGDQCGVSTTATVTAVQNGCTVTFDVPAIAAVTINVTRPNLPGRVQKTAACDNLNLAGSADELSATRIHVIYGEGPDGCCRHGAFTLTR